MPDPHGDYYASDSSSSGTGNETLDASGKPFKFNPPLHPSARHVRPDLTSSDRTITSRSYDSIYSERRNSYPSDSLTDKSRSPFTDLRLGRIVMGNTAMTWAMQDASTRYGFRFLYNPETVQRGATVGTDFIPDPTLALNFVLQEGLERISFQLLLNRIPDLNGPSRRSDYSPGIDQTEWGQIQRRGTHYDLEYLYRVANGLQHTQVRRNTGDIGILLPNPCWLVLGGQKTRGALESVQATDKLFSKDLVPTLTYVTITFARYLTTNLDDVALLEAQGISTGAGSGGDVIEDDTAPVSSNTPTGGTLTGRQVYDLARKVGFTPNQAEIMTNIAWGESSWRSGIYNFCCHGLWQIYFDVHKGWLKQFGVTKKEDLHDPMANARAAKYLFDNGKPNYGDWDAYTQAGWGRTRFKWRR